MNTIYIYAGAFHISRDAAAEYNILRERAVILYHVIQLMLMMAASSFHC